ncbi:hypothetical protein N7492_008273 [Penicillium capsulatum]|uniref:Peptidase S8/S53 domain-containing protein n=1 Tax=Penicillium capsulatum TaxID=69766 RepID=A0A9W9LH62_9EURO|nr:hypothetical protein N7492_008273 [Penicillium capsulatum]KAJ6105683.1 hypothetical protein N7512_009200 [Penicillium capsulatum]
MRSLYIIFVVTLLVSCLAVSASLSGTMQPTNEHAIHQPNEKRFLNPSNEKTKYIITPKDGTDETTRADIEKFLKKTTRAESIYSFTDQTRGRFMWWTVHATKEQYEQIKGYKGIAYVAAPTKLSDRRAIPTNWTDNRDSPDNSKELPLLSLVTKRDRGQVYQAQSEAPKELRHISIPKGSDDLDEWSDYVYNKAAGENFYIYYISNGISDKDAVLQELPRARVLDAVQTDYCKTLYGNEPRGYESRGTHSTCVASKAIGKTYGASKKAFLVPVKIGDMDLSGLSQGLDAAAKNVRDEGRQKQAAVLISAGSEKVVDEHNLGDDEVVYQSQNDYIGILADLGVSTIVATGNDANEMDGNGKLRLEPDTLPDILAKHHPIILVGNVDWDGKLWASSQRGDLVTSNAMGVDVTCVGKSGKKMTDTGTSFAAPLMAGQVANFVSSKDPSLPFNAEGISNREFVVKIRDFIRDEAYWKRSSGVKSLWNLVTKEIYEEAEREEDC